MVSEKLLAIWKERGMTHKLVELEEKQSPTTHKKSRAKVWHLKYKKLHLYLERSLLNAIGWRENEFHKGVSRKLNDILRQYLGKPEKNDGSGSKNSNRILLKTDDVGDAEGEEEEI